MSRGRRWLIGLGFGFVALIAAMVFAGKSLYPTHTDQNLAELVTEFGPVCSGQTVAGARAFTKADLSMIILDDQGKTSDETEGSLPTVWTADQISLVVCAGAPRDEQMSTCWYSGSDFRIIRYARVRAYRAVVARTGQVLVADELRATADDCPSSVSQASGEDTWYGDLSNLMSVRETIGWAVKKESDTGVTPTPSPGSTR